MADDSSPDKQRTFMAIWKDLLALVRDTLLLALALLLLLFPKAFNQLLVNAGFEEGSLVGFTWKAKLVESDQALKEAQAALTDLTAQNEKLTAELAGAQANAPESIGKERLTELEAMNTRLKAASAKVEANVQTTIADNAAFVEKAQSLSSTGLRWGVVYGGDTDLASAQHETGPIAGKFALTNAAVYYRQRSFRSVAIAADRSEAEQLLYKAKTRRSDAYIVNMDRWCPNGIQKEGYIECVSP